jgi:peptidoglycan hydrolase-like protein with peptidoglycan-binding domain
MLSILSVYIPEIPTLTIDGIYGPSTKSAVLAAQRRFRLPETGVVDAEVWKEIYDQYAGIENTTLRNRNNFPTAQNPTQQQSAESSTMQQFPGYDLKTGQRDSVAQEVVR